MLALLLATFFSASFGLVMRYAQGRRANIWAVGAINYWVASLVHLARAALGGLTAPALSTLLIGVGGGLAFVISFGLFSAGIARRGVSISSAVVRVSIVIPIAVAILFWGERPDGVQALGGALALVSLPLLTLAPRAKPPAAAAQPAAIDRQGILVLAVLFLTNGMCTLSTRWFSQTGVVGQDSLFLAVVFGTAAVVATVVWWTRHRAPADGAGWLRDFVPGAGLGICNAVANLALLSALSALPSVVVFPFQSAVGLVYVAIVARLVWAERIRRTEAAGMAMALVAVVLINLS